MIDNTSPNLHLPLPNEKNELGVDVNRITDALLILDTVISDAENKPAIPKGIIVLWSGIITEIPTGWALCDGTNNTPDLRNRFVIGTGDTYTQNATGGYTNCAGSMTATPLVYTSATTLDLSTIASHHHTFSARTGGEAYDRISLAGNTHPVWGDYYTTNSGGSQPHSHTLAGHTHTFTGGANSNLPPYMALCYIIKL